MRIPRIRTIVIVSVGILAVAVIVSVSHGQAAKRSDPADVEKTVLARLAEIQDAAQKLDADKVFSFVLENDQGALVQNGKLLLTRQEALEATKLGLQGLRKVNYKFDEQHVTLLSPAIALAVGVGTSSATTADGSTVSAPFA